MRGLVPRIHVFGAANNSPPPHPESLPSGLTRGSIAISPFTRVFDALWRCVSKDAAAPLSPRHGRACRGHPRL